MTSDPTPISPTGLLIIDKHQGPTSMQVCANVRARLRRAGAPKRVKVGHAGTLDPLATGVLVVLIGKATKLCDRFMGGEKEYEAVIDLSGRTATDDAEGEVTLIDVPVPPTRERVEEAVRAFVGVIMQSPPAFSAVHVDGERAYALARKGEAPVLPPRPVVVREFRVDSYEWPLVRATIVCAKGTYIRSLARDLGTALGVGGFLAGLRRTRVGAFRVTEAVMLASLPDALSQADLLPVPDLTPHAE